MGRSKGTGGGRGRSVAKRGQPGERRALASARPIHLEETPASSTRLEASAAAATGSQTGSLGPGETGRSTCLLPGRTDGRRMHAQPPRRTHLDDQPSGGGAGVAPVAAPCAREGGPGRRGRRGQASPAGEAGALVAVAAAARRGRPAALGRRGRRGVSRPGAVGGAVGCWARCVPGVGHGGSGDGCWTLRPGWRSPALSHHVRSPSPARACRCASGTSPAGRRRDGTGAAPASSGTVRQRVGGSTHPRTQPSTSGCVLHERPSGLSRAHPRGCTCDATPARRWP